MSTFVGITASLSLIYFCVLLTCFWLMLIMRPLQNYSRDNLNRRPLVDATIILPRFWIGIFDEQNEHLNETIEFFSFDENENVTCICSVCLHDFSNKESIV